MPVTLRMQVFLMVIIVVVSLGLNLAAQGIDSVVGSTYGKALDLELKNEKLQLLAFGETYDFGKINILAVVWWENCTRQYRLIKYNVQGYWQQVKDMFIVDRGQSI